MKKAYVKPEIAVENIFLDQPIAQNCLTSREDMKALEDMGYFGDGCTIFVDGEGRIDMNGNRVIDDGEVDTVCYHSNVQQAWYS